METINKRSASHKVNVGETCFVEPAKWFGTDNCIMGLGEGGR